MPTMQRSTQCSMGSWVLLCSIMTLSATLVSGQGFPTFETVGHVGGYVNTAAVRDQIAWICRANVLAAIDLEDPAVRQLAFVDFPEEPTDIVLANDLAFLVYQNTLQAVNVADVHHPVPLGTLQAAPEDQWISALAIGEDTVFLALNGEGLVVVDVSDPALPTVVVSLDLPATSISISGNDAYITTGDELSVLDISDPLAPFPVGHLPLLGARDMFLDGQAAYVFGGLGTGLSIVDITSPSLPVLLAMTAQGETIDQVFVADGRAYLFDFFGRLRIVDVSDPASPVELGMLSVDGFGSVTSLQVVGDRAYFTYSGQFQTVDVADPQNPMLSPGLEMPETIVDLDLAGGVLYLASPHRVWRFALGDPTDPILEAAVTATGRLHRLDAEADRVYALGDKLEVIDFSTPSQGVVLGSYQPSGPIADLQVADDVVYLLRRTGGIETVDVSDPAAPFELGEATATGIGRDLFLDPQQSLLLTVLAADSGGQLGVFDVSNPAAPILRSASPTAGVPIALWSKGDRALVAGNRDDGRWILEAFDLTGASPNALETIDGRGFSWDIEVLEDGLIVASIPGGSLHAFTFQDAFAVGPVHELPESRDLAVLDAAGADYAYAINGYGTEVLAEKLTYGSKGLYITRITSGLEATLTLGASSAPEISCPDELQESPTVVANLDVCVDELDDWQITSLKLNAFGSGDDARDVKTVELEVRGRTLTESFSADNGTVSLAIGEVVHRGGCLPMQLSYHLDPETLACPLDPIQTFGVVTSVADLAAEPLNLDRYQKLPRAPFVLSTASVACVRNASHELYFPTVQSAIDDPRIQDGDVVELCPGIYSESAAVTKRLTLRSTQGPAVTRMVGDQTQDVVTIQRGGSRIIGLTLTSGANGVGIRGVANVLIQGNVLSGNTASGVLIQGENAHGHRLLDNRIGTTPNGLNAAANGQHGVLLDGAPKNVVRNNLISGNTGHGVYIVGMSALENQLLDNRIGVDAGDREILGNGGDGVRVESAPGTVLQHNFVTASGGSGIAVVGPDADDTVVLENVLGLAEPPEVVTSRPSFSTLKNEIRGNAEHGLLIQEQTLPPIRGNKIIANGKNGVHIKDASNNVIGEKLDAELVPGADCVGNCNLITQNGKAGVAVEGRTERKTNLSVNNTIRGNHIFDNKGLGIDLLDDGDTAVSGITPNDMIGYRTTTLKKPLPPDRDIGPNSLMNFPAMLTYDRNMKVITGILDTVPESFPVMIDFYVDEKLQSFDLGSGKKQHTVEGLKLVGSLKLDREAGVKDTIGLDNFIFETSEPLIPGVFLTALVTDSTGNTSELAPVSCRDMAEGDPDSKNFDNDGDGLCDSWEEEGIDYDGDGEIDLHLEEKADPNHKDLFLEIDYSDCNVPGGVCVDPESGNPLPADHHDRPGDKAIGDVQRAFERAPVENPDQRDGIALHVWIDDPVPHDRGREIKHVVDVKFGDDPRGGLQHPCERIPRQDAVALGFFGTESERLSKSCPQIIGAKLATFRYGVFGHAFTSGTGGEAEVWGDDFMIGIGARSTATLLEQAGLPGSGKRADAERHVQASILMHEFGHTLALHHGGQDDVNCKPNYLSVMNYAYSYRDFAKRRPLDYSRSVFRALEEVELEEKAGLQLERASEGFAITSWNVVHAFGRTREFPEFIRFPAANSAVNWGGEPHRIDEGERVAADINLVSHQGASSLRCDQLTPSNATPNTSNVEHLENGDFKLTSNAFATYYFNPEQLEDPAKRPKLVGRSFKVIKLQPVLFEGKIFQKEFIADSGKIVAHDGDKIVVRGLTSSPKVASRWIFGERLDSFEDWPYLRYGFRESPYYGKLARGSATFEEPIDGEDILPEEAKERDFDHDGISDFDDNCPADPNPGQQDTDVDGYGDACDTCPLVPNLIFDDADEDGIGDACDDGQAPSQLRFELAEIPVLEGAGDATVTLLRTGNQVGAVAVHWATGHGTAAENVDYEAAAGMVMWSDGEGGGKDVTIRILDDEEGEGSETIPLLLSSPLGNAVLGQPDQALIRLADDDDPEEIPTLGSWMLALWAALLLIMGLASLRKVDRQPNAKRE